MESEKDELGADQELLILYLSGEMSEHERSSLERRLESDGSLKSELDRLRAAQAAVWREMLAADSEEPMRGAASSAHRRLAGMVRQWSAERVVAEPTVVHGHGGWRIGLAAAAAIAVGIGTYVFWPAQRTPDVLVQAANPAPAEGSDEALPVDEQFVTLTLTEVEQELDELVQLRALTQ